MINMQPVAKIFELFRLIIHHCDFSETPRRIELIFFHDALNFCFFVWKKNQEMTYSNKN